MRVPSWAVAGQLRPTECCSRKTESVTASMQHQFPLGGSWAVMRFRSGANLNRILGACIPTYHQLRNSGTSVRPHVRPAALMNPQPSKIDPKLLQALELGPPRKGPLIEARPYRFPREQFLFVRWEPIGEAMHTSDVVATTVFSVLRRVCGHARTVFHMFFHSSLYWRITGHMY